MRRFWVALVVAVLLSGSILALNATGHPKMLQQEQVKALAQLPEVRFISVDKDGVPDFVVGRLGHLPTPDVEGAVDYIHGISAVLRCWNRGIRRPMSSASFTCAFPSPSAASRWWAPISGCTSTATAVRCWWSTAAWRPTTP